MTKESFFQYLRDVGIVDLFSERAYEVLQFYENIYPGKIEDIFVSEYLDDGKRQYESMWFFSSQILMEAKRFLTEDDFDASPFRKKLKYWQLKKVDFDFINTSDKSRLTIEFVMDHNIGGTLKASQNNCTVLYKLFLKHIAPNMLE